MIASVDKATVSLGSELRRLRALKAMSLQAVSDATRRVIADPDAWISQPYLSQIESGSAEGIAFPKLYALAVIYDVPVEDLVRMASGALRPKLERQRAEYIAAGKMIPRAASFALFGVKEDRLVETVWALLAPKASDVSIPVAAEFTAKATVVSAIGRWTCIPAWLTSTEHLPPAARDVLFAFEARAMPMIESRDVPAGHSLTWDAVARAFADFALSDRVACLLAIDCLDRWSVEFPRLLASCRLGVPSQRAEFTRVPLPVIEAVGRATIAQVIERHTSIRLRNAPPPPPLHGAKAYMVWLAGSQLSMRGADFDINVDDLAACGETILSIAQLLGGRSRPSELAMCSSEVREYLDTTKKRFEKNLYRSTPLRRSARPRKASS